MAEQAFPRAGTSLHNGRLLLTPDNPGAQVPRERLARRLQEAGLLGTAQADTPGTYSTGPHLFELVAFTGCAVQLDDGGAGAGIQVRLEGPFSTPTRRSGRNARPPRCPQCRRPLLRWAQQLDAAGAAGVHGNSTEERLRCEACDTEAPAWSWDWGRLAGYGSLFVALEPVFPGEGRPLPKLFRALDALEVGPWRHFYVQD